VEIEVMVVECCVDCEEYVNEVVIVFMKELDKVGILVDILGCVKHLYVIYDKMFKKGCEFNEIYDFMVMWVIVEYVSDEGMCDCYGVFGFIYLFCRCVCCARMVF